VRAIIGEFSHRRVGVGGEIEGHFDLIDIGRKGISSTGRIVIRRSHVDVPGEGQVLSKNDFCVQCRGSYGAGREQCFEIFSHV